MVAEKDCTRLFSQGRKEEQIEDQDSTQLYVVRITIILVFLGAILEAYIWFPHIK